MLGKTFECFGDQVLQLRACSVTERQRDSILKFECYGIDYGPSMVFSTIPHILRDMMISYQGDDQQKVNDKCKDKDHDKDIYRTQPQRDLKTLKE